MNLILLSTDLLKSGGKDGVLKDEPVEGANPEIRDCPKCGRLDVAAATDASVEVDNAVVFGTKKALN